MAAANLPGGPRRASEQPGYRIGVDPNNPNNPVDPNNPPDPNNPNQPNQNPPNPNQPNQGYGSPGPVVSGQPSFPGSNLPPGFLPPGIVPGQPGQPVRFPGYPTGAANSQTNPQPYTPYNPFPNSNQQQQQQQQPVPNQAPLSGANNPALGMIQRLLTTPNPNGQQIANSIGQPSTPQGAGIAGIASKHDAEGIKLVNERSNIKEWEFVYDPAQDKSGQKAGTGQVPNVNGNSNTNNSNNSNGNNNNGNKPSSTGSGTSPFGSGTPFGQGSPYGQPQQQTPQQRPR